MAEDNVPELRKNTTTISVRRSQEKTSKVNFVLSKKYSLENLDTMLSQQRKNTNGFVISKLLFTFCGQICMEIQSIFCSFLRGPLVCNYCKLFRRLPI